MRDMRDGEQMKAGDIVKITATAEDLKYIPEYSRIPILKQKKGIVRHVYKDAVDISFGIAGIWEIKKEFVEEVK
jgi:hypothetical protein